MAASVQAVFGGRSMCLTKSVIRHSVRLNRRQTEGGRVAVAACTGGESRKSFGGLSDQRRDDELRRNPGARERRAAGRQQIKIAQRFEPLEGKFDLPAQTVEGNDVSGRNAVQRRDNKGPVGRFEGAGIRSFAVTFCVLSEARGARVRQLAAVCAPPRGAP